MASILQDLFIVCTLICGVKNNEDACYAGWNGEINCISVRYVSIGLLNNVEGDDVISKTKTITIKNSQRLDIVPGAFKHAKTVQHILVSNNVIKKIHNGTFKDLPVKHLFIEFNDIDEIEYGAFSNLSSLETLVFHDNKYDEIPTGLFANLPITTLKLDSNGISMLEDLVLKDLPNLKYLSLTYNKLQWLYVHEIVTYPQLLEALHLQNNNLTLISNYMLLKLKSLKDLLLQNNLIAYIEPRAFAQTEALENLDLSGNRLKDLNENVFPSAGLENLVFLYLDNNKLMYLPTNFFLRAGYLRKVTVFGNPWWCPCFKEMEKFFAEEEITTYSIEEYLTGRSPICISEKVDNLKCKKWYSEDSSKKYLYHLGLSLQ